MLNLDTFKPIENYENCLINEEGQIYLKKKNKFLKPFKMKNDYLHVILMNKRNCQLFPIHRLVAMTFIPNPDNLECVIHKDGDKLNNHISNLEWCTRSQSTKNSWDNCLEKGIRESCVRHLDDNLKNLFDDIFKNNLKTKDIAKKFNLSQPYVSQIKNKRTLKTALNEYFDKNPDIVYQPKSNNKVKKVSFKKKITKCNF